MICILDLDTVMPVIDLDTAELRYSVHLDGWGTPREIPRGVYIIIDGYHQL